MMNSPSNTTAAFSCLHFFELRSGFEHPQLAPLSADLLPGQHLALSGASGCGKSSLLQVIAGLKSPRRGHFNYQQQQIDAGSLSFWRQQICYLPQQAVMGPKRCWRYCYCHGILKRCNLPIHRSNIVSKHYCKQG